MLKDTFCSSPWFHTRITHDGGFRLCRWGKDDSTSTLRTHSIVEFYNSDEMKTLRTRLLNGDAPGNCADCYYEQSFGKLTGRIRQLHKSAIDINQFDLTARSSPHYNHFKFSLDNNGISDYQLADLQIDLGNTCNSGCIMCSPIASSRLAVDYRKLNKRDPVLFKDVSKYKSWTNDPELLNSVVEQISKLDNLKYIHFIGGETLYDPAFYQICDQLINTNLAANLIVGTTTNATIYNDKLEKYIQGFKEFHLGISIESVTELNDYIRYPSKIQQVLENINKFLELKKTNPGLYISLRITPNVFSVYEIDKLFVYMIENNVAAESCNIMSDPACLRMELIPDDIRIEIQNKIKDVIDYYELSKNNIVNVRRDDLVDDVIADTILDYYNFVNTYQQPENIEQSRHDLVKWIKAFESIRNNSILTYVPRYEKFLRTYGY